MAPWAYVDTSLLAARYIATPDAARFRRLLRSHRLVTSAITPAELSSVLAQRRAAGDLVESACDAILQRLADDRQYWDSIPVTEEVLSKAEAVIHRTGARTLDAVHLASALLRRDAGLLSLPFLTRDARQARAARELGLAVIGVP